VNRDLFPYLQSFKTRADGPNSVEYKIGEIFGEIKNKFQSGYSLRDALELVDALGFRSQEQKHELSHLYEEKLRNMGNAGRNGGEYYTPRPLIRAMIQVVKPKIGERIYDGACGSAGFLCESFEYLTRDRGALSTKNMRALQERTFYGKEKKSLAYILGIMNMILHGIESLLCAKHAQSGVQLVRCATFLQRSSREIAMLIIFCSAVRRYRKKISPNHSPYKISGRDRNCK
jgi:type I restriction enzyme M protein